MRATASPTEYECGELAADVEVALSRSAELDDLYMAADALRSRPDRLRAKLRFIRENPDLLMALAGRSYRHSNGFTKVKLVAGDRFSVRLHLWPASTGVRGDSNPHGHRWEFASWIVCGDGMTERTYERTDAELSARGYDLWVFGSTRDGVRYIRPRERAWLTETQRLRRAPGSVYVCPRETVHAVAPAGDGFVATVVVQGRDLVDAVPVYAPFAHSPKARERPISVAELRAEFIALERVLARDVEVAA